MAELMRYDVENDSLVKSPEAEKNSEKEKVISETTLKLLELQQNILQWSEKKVDVTKPEGKYAKLNKIFSDEYASSVKEKRKPRYKTENEDKKESRNNIGKATVMEVKKWWKEYIVKANPQDKQMYVAETMVDGKKATMSVEFTIDGTYEIMTTIGGKKHTWSDANTKANQLFKGLFQ